MKVARVRKKEEIKREKETNEYSVKRIIKILGCVVLVFVIFYFITVLLVNNKKEDNVDSPAVIDSSKIILNQLLSQNEEEYFVIATKASLYEASYLNMDYIALYSDYITDYKKNEDALTFYYVDLDDALNKKYMTQNLNISNDIKNLELNDEVLFKIKDGKIEKYYIGKDEILDKLSRL